MELVELSVQIVDGASPTITTPAYQTAGAAGFDLQANICRRILLGSRDWMMVPTGLRIAIPEGFEGQIRSRSSVALRHGVQVLNSPGTIDSDYRGDISVVLINHSNVPYQINPGDRIAQMIIARVTQPLIRITNTLNSTDRGESGWGSTGK